MISRYVAAWVAPGPVALIAMAYLPGTTPEDALNVAVDELPVGIEEGLKLAVTPDGRPVADSATIWLAPAVVSVDTVAATERFGVVTPLLAAVMMSKSSEAGGGVGVVPV